MNENYLEWKGSWKQHRPALRQCDCAIYRAQENPDTIAAAC